MSDDDSTTLIDFGSPLLDDVLRKLRYMLGAAKLYGGGFMLDLLYAGVSWPLAVFETLANILAAMAVLTLFLTMRASPPASLSRSLQGLIGVCGLTISMILAAYNIPGWNIPG